MSEKIKPCAMCGNAPRSYEYEHSEYWTEYYYCTCEPSDQESVTMLDWNRKQEIILAMRRKDFEAGCRTALESNFADTFFSAQSDLTCSEFRDKIWDEYLVRTKHVRES
jgi:hypothetical protein